MLAAGMSYRAMAQVLAGVGSVSSAGQPLAPMQLGRILQWLGLAGKSQGVDLRLVAAGALPFPCQLTCKDPCPNPIWTG